jgi:hypothetical protein
MRALVLFLLTCVGSPLAVAEDTSRLTVSAWADVDAEGRVSGLEFKTDLPKSIEGVARGIFEPLRFEPATLGGEPAPSRTTLRTTLELTPDNSGGYVVKVVDLDQIGSYVVSTSPPQYPRDALRGRVGGKIWLEVSINAQGRVDVAQSKVFASRFHRGGKPYEGKYGQQLIDAAREAMAQWTFAQPEVAGVPIPTRLRLPITFGPPLSGRESPFDYGEFDRQSASPASGDADRQLASLILPDGAATQN